jgi:acyl carrier protein
MIYKKITLSILKECFLELVDYEFDISRSLSNQGLDSLDEVELCFKIEKKLETSINDDEWEKFILNNNYRFLLEEERKNKLNALGI